MSSALVSVLVLGSLLSRPVDITTDDFVVSATTNYVAAATPMGRSDVPVAWTEDRSAAVADGLYIVPYFRKDANEVAAPLYPVYRRVFGAYQVDRIEVLEYHSGCSETNITHAIVDESKRPPYVNRLVFTDGF